MQGMRTLEHQEVRNPVSRKPKTTHQNPNQEKKKKRNAGDANLRALRGCRGRKSYLLCCVYTRAYGAIYECVVGLSGAIPSEGLQFFFFLSCSYYYFSGHLEMHFPPANILSTCSYKSGAPVRTLFHSLHLANAEEILTLTLYIDLCDARPGGTLPFLLVKGTVCLPSASDDC